MLTQLQTRNFRCLENIHVPLGRLVAFVGPNGVGKTSILRAIELLLGDAWPSLRSFRIPQDFTNFDPSRDIEIVVGFDPPYLHRDTHSTEHRISALRLTCKPYKKTGKWGEVGDLHVDLDPLDEQNKVPSVAIGQPTKGQKTQYGPLRVGTELREHARILFIDHRRSLAQHLPGLRGSVLARLLQPARKEFKAQADFRKAYEQAMDLLRTDQVKRIEETVAATAKRMLGFLGRDVARSVEIGFGFSDPANPFSSLRLQYRESGLTVSGEELGLGIQSAMVVGIFEAFRQLGGDFGTLIIEEPEMYLHPQAQRYFFRLLCDMTDRAHCQVIYSTHSPIFADVNRFESLRVVRRKAGSHSTVSFVRDADVKALSEERDRQKLAGRFDATRNEVLFASRALLVEGQGDRVAALMVAEKLNVDVDAEGGAIVDCGGKNAIPLISRVCRSLEVPFAVLHDEDMWPTENAEDPAKQAEDNEKALVENQRIAEAVGTAGNLSIASPSLEALLGIGKSARDKPLKIVEKLQNMALADVPAPLLEATKAVLPPTAD